MKKRWTTKTTSEKNGNEHRNGKENRGSREGGGEQRVEDCRRMKHLGEKCGEMKEGGEG